MIRIFFSFFFYFSIVFTTLGQVSITGTSFNYSQDFDVLANSGTGNSWSNNTTITGWYSDRSTYDASTGSSTTGSLFSYGSLSSNERALGSLCTNTTSNIHYGLRLKNDSGSTISNITISYTGEQWRNSGAGTTNTLLFSYQISTSPITSLTTGTWTNVPNLNFSSPINTGTAGALDGNLSSNRTSLNFAISLTLPASSEIMFRFLDTNDPGNDHGMSIDNFAISNVILPVTFSNFYLKNNLLYWQTSSEVNNDYFNVERSEDGKSFASIGEIKGAGTSQNINNYSFIDTEPIQGLNYYRIKQTDFDGQFSYSEVKSARFSTKGNVTISPRNTEGRLDISTEMESYDVAVYNSAGQEVEKFISLTGNQTVSIESLQAGVYFVKVMNGFDSETIRIVKF